MEPEPSRVALIPDEDFLSHAPWCYYGSYYGSLLMSSLESADCMPTSAGVLRLMVTEWSVYARGRCGMPQDRVRRTPKPSAEGSNPSTPANYPFPFYRITACFLAGRCYSHEAS